jgi:hypothetical protein
MAYDDDLVPSSGGTDQCADIRGVRADLIVSGVGRFPVTAQIRCDPARAEAAAPGQVVPDLACRTQAMEKNEKPRALPASVECEIHGRLPPL